MRKNIFGEELNKKLEVFNDEAVEELAKSFETAIKLRAEKIRSEEAETLLEENKRLLKQNGHLRLQNKIYTQKVLSNSAPLIEKLVQTAVDDFKKNNLDKVEEIKNSLGEIKELIEQIDTIVEQKRLNAEKRFFPKIEKLNDEVRTIFREEIKEYIAKIHIENDAETFIKKKLISAVQVFRSEKIDQIIKSLYEKIAMKYNLLLSKNILKDISQMTLIQAQTIEKCSIHIAEREKEYLSKIESKIRPFLLEEKK